MTREQLKGCHDALKAVETLLQKYTPSNSKIVGKSLKALVWALKTAKRDSVLKRLERQKSILQLALLGTSVYNSIRRGSDVDIRTRKQRTKQEKIATFDKRKLRRLGNNGSKPKLQTRRTAVN